MKKKLAIVVMAMVLAGLMVGTSIPATPPYYVCTVNATGQAVSGPMINLTNSAGDWPVFSTAPVTNRWFAFPTTGTNNCYAAALTAISAGLSVFVYLPSTNPGTEVGYLYAVQPSDKYVP